MISFYTGTPGSGKSYHLAQLVYDKLKYQDVNIIANFDINLDVIALTRLGWFKKRITALSHDKIKFKKYNSRPLKGRFYYWDNSQLSVKNLLLFAQQHHVRRQKSVDAPQTIVLIDEAGIVFNCRGFSDKSRNEWVSFFAKHRHFNFSFVLACQFDRQVDKQIRCCVEYEQIHRKLRNYQFLGFLFSMLAGGNLFVVVENWYCNKLKIATHAMRYKQRIAAMYDTLHDFSDALGSSADGPPPGVSGDRGPTAPTPESSSADVQPSDNQLAIQQQPRGLDIRNRWKQILKKTGE